MNTKCITEQLKCAVAVSVLAVTVGIDADTIVLKRSASIEPEQNTITLGAIAELTGGDAQQFADLPIVPRPEQSEHTVTVTVQDVRAALDEAGAHWGRIDLSGWKTSVQLLVADAQPPQAMAGASIVDEDASAPQRDAADPEAQRAEQLATQSTVRGVVARSLARQLRIQPSDLRLTFDPRDNELLDLAMQQYRIELEPRSSLHADSITLHIRAWNGTEVAHRGTIRIGVQVRRQAATITGEVRRGHAIRNSDITAKPVWIGAGELRELMTVDEAVDRIATQSLDPGDVLRQRDARRETLIERGDVVQVRCLVGGVVISMQAEAREDGSEGDSIEFRKVGERETFRAKVVSRSEAVIELDR